MVHTFRLFFYHIHRVIYRLSIILDLLRGSVSSDDRCPTPHLVVGGRYSLSKRLRLTPPQYQKQGGHDLHTLLADHTMEDKRNQNFHRYTAIMAKTERIIAFS